jgi:septation ring formation regulator EzrA
MKLLLSIVTILVVISLNGCSIKKATEFQIEELKEIK